MRQSLSLAVCIAALVSIAGCGENDSAIIGTDDNPPPSDLYPERIDGTESTEFEPEDLRAAENASQEVQDYCAGAVSEAQYEGCLSHVEGFP